MVDTFFSVSALNRELANRRNELLREMFRLVQYAKSGSSSALLEEEEEEEGKEMDEELERFLDRFDLRKKCVYLFSLPPFSVFSFVAKRFAETRCLINVYVAMHGTVLKPVRS